MMKKILIITVCLLCLFAPAKASAQSKEAAQLLLNVEKLAQFKQILRDMKKGYQILSKGYNTVKDISQGNFNLHKAFLDGLLQVSPTVRNYSRIADIINSQITMVREYQSAQERFEAGGRFTAGELGYISGVYDNLFDKSLQNLDELTTIITAGKLRMSDDERLAAIDRIYTDMQDKLQFLRHFNQNTSILALQRAKDARDVQSTGRLYGIENN